MRWLHWLREPLAQFMLIGAALFVVFESRDGSSAGSQRIVVSPGQVEAVVAGFIRTWNRAPDERELKAQLDELVREEIATREARAIGLDRDDTVIRRRLRQKFEFTAEDAFDTAAPPTDAELQAFLDSYPDTFRREARFTFRQVHLGPQRGSALAGDAQRLLEQLAAAGAAADTRRLGDSRLLPAGLERASPGEVARIFGDGFAAALLEVEPGRWAGPLRSGYGLHLVMVDQREGGQLPALAEVRPLVERDFMAERRKRQLDTLYAKLLGRYQVVIAPRPVASAPAGTSASLPPK